MYTTRTTCRVCGSKDLTPLFSLGEQYVSDFVDSPSTKLHEGKCPIDLELCNNCTLVQQKHTAPQDFLYTRHYWYRSGVTQTMRDNLRDVVIAAEKVADLQPNDVVLDIGSNDGTLLRSYAVPVVTIGVEPASNLVEEGAIGVDHLIHDFWNYQSYYDVMEDNKKAKVITAIGMFYDLEDPNQFIADVKNALHEDGVFISQLMCLKNMVALNDVGNLAHEHLEFYSLESLIYLFNKHNLQIFDIETNDVNGESYRIFAQHSSLYLNRGVENSVFEALYEEKKMGLDDPDTYAAWFQKMEDNRKKTYSFIKERSDEEDKIWVYGASTKGNVLLQYYGIDRTMIVGASDRSPEKWGKYTIGTGIKIYSEEEARKSNPDYFLVLPYTFLDEFIKREKEWRDKGGKFIVPLPEFRIV